MKQHNVNKWLNPSAENLKVIHVKRNENYSDWEVHADGDCWYHSSGIGYKGRTERERIDNLVEELRQELNDDGFTNIEVDEVVE